VACDSRTTHPLGYIDDNAAKLHIVEFQDGNSGIVAEAGNAEYSSIAVENLIRSAKTKTISDYRSMAECADSAIGEMKRKIRDQNAGASAEELRKIFEDHDFELMMAHYFNGVPYIFTTSLVGGLASKGDHLYAAIGCGWILSDFLISRLDVSEFGTGQGIWAAVYAIEEIKRFDNRCGGRTRAAIVSEPDPGKSQAVICADYAMQQVIDETLAFSRESAEQWKQTIETRIRMAIARGLQSPPDSHQ